MLQTRLWMGAILIALTVGVLVGDRYMAPVYPCLLVLVLGLTLLACYELLNLLSPERRPSPWLCYATVTALIVVNWVPHLVGDREPWRWVATTLGLAVLAVFLEEMRLYRVPGQAVARMSHFVWLVAYLGLLPSFLVQIRWLPDLEPGGVGRGILGIALAVFVPKMGDTGAYFTGRLFGKHPMTPLLSPKKTWEGAAGALAGSTLTAFGINSLGLALRGGFWGVAAFGVVVSVVGLLGDLAESLIKRDCGHKDASQVVPGFGGVLDVVDAVIFSAPVVYLWMTL